MNPNSSTKLMGLIGHDINYSLSPDIHNFSTELLGINSAYLCLPVTTGNIEAALETFWDIGCEGLNVTKPHKLAVGRLLDPVNPKSINTLKRGPNGWEGSSTDGLGFAIALKRLGLEIGGFKKIVIIGNGGAASAIVDHVRLSFDQHPELVIARRNKNLDATFKLNVGDVKVRFCELNVNNIASELYREAGSVLCIQATSAPILGDDLHYLVPVLDNFSGVFVDLVYGKPSALYNRAKQKGLLCQDGLPMLIEQARLSQKIWWGRCADFDAIESHLKQNSSSG